MLMQMPCNPHEPELKIVLASMLISISEDYSVNFASVGQIRARPMRRNWASGRRPLHRGALSIQLRHSF